MAKRIITLTGRRPVTIDEETWPILASAKGDSYDGTDAAWHRQALEGGQLDTYTIFARQHADGRALVYAILKGATPWTGSVDRRGGELVRSGGDIASALVRVGAFCRIPPEVVTAAIAMLPSEELP